MIERTTAPTAPAGDRPGRAGAAMASAADPLAIAADGPALLGTQLATSPPGGARRRPKAPSPPEVLALQRAIGNAAAVSLLRNAPGVAEPGRRPGPLPRAGGIIQRQERVQEPTVTPAGGELAANFVEQELERFLTRFSAIEVSVPGQREPLRVHPPYFMNVNEGAGPETRARHAAAMTQRSRLGRGVWRGFVDRVEARVQARLERENGAGGSREQNPADAATRWATVGKGSPETIRDILEQALADGMIRPPEGRSELTAEDLRAWLGRYGIGIDCTGFVVQALNHVAAEGFARLGRPVGEAPYLAGQRPQGRGEFEAIERPSDLRPGDVMRLSGHVRVVVRVLERDRGTEVVTAEASSGSYEGITDQGPGSARWWFSDPSRFDSEHRWLRGPGPAIARRRADQGLSRPRLADRARVGVTRLHRIERRRASPSPEELERIAAALGVAAADLEGFEEFSPVTEEELRFDRWHGLAQLGPAPEAPTESPAR